MIGTIVSHYRVIARLGAGGMSVVYAAEDTVLGRRVALKIPGEALQNDPAFRSRFLREARSAAAVTHPGLCTIYEAGEHDGRLFLAMELIDGAPLRERLAAGAMAAGDLVNLAVQVADALGAAHAAGLVHRDVKPGNIMITTSGRARVMDFGLVKRLARGAPGGMGGTAPGQADGGAEALHTETLLTNDVAVVGTFAYMSPEQARGRDVDARSDVFSLGAVLYEMATGRRAFEGSSQAVIFDAILNRTPAPIAQHNPSMPLALQGIVDKALAKDREARYGSMAAMRADLARLGQTLAPTGGRPDDAAPRRQPAPSVDAARTRRARMSRPASVGAAALVLAAIGGGLVWMAPFRDRHEPPTFQAPTIDALTFGGKAQLAAISPDGQHVVHAEWDGSSSSLWARQVAAAGQVQILPPAEGEFDGLTFSADGEYVYYVWYAKDTTTGIAYRIPALGGAPRKVLEDVDTPLTFSPDATSFAFIRTATSKTSVIIAEAGGTGERVLATRTPPLQFLVIDLAWSPDGNYIATADRDRRDGTVRLLAIDVRTGAERLLTEAPWSGFSGLAWLPGGRGLIVTGTSQAVATTGNQVFQVPWPPGPLRRISSDPAAYSVPRLSADGRALVLVREDRSVRLWTVRAGDASKMTSTGVIGDGMSGLDVAPDGAIVYTSMASGRPDVWLAEPGGAPRPVTFDDEAELVPRFTPDGRQIVYYAIGGGASTLCRIGRDGTGRAVIARTAPRSLNAPTSAFVTPDGDAVLFTDAIHGIARVPHDGARAERLALPALDGSGTPIALLAMTADGRRLAVSYLDAGERRNRVAVVSGDGRDVLYRLDLPGAAPGVGGRPMQFSTDGRFLYFASTRDGAGNVFKAAVDGRDPVQVTHFPSDPIARFAVSPDETTIVVSRGPVRADVVLMKDLAAAVQ